MGEGLIDELEKGPWPSHVTEMKRTGYKELVAIYEKMYQDRVVHWKHGGMVGIPGYDSGVIGRLSDSPEIIRDNHSLRITSPAAWFYTTRHLREICDIWERYGRGLMNFHGAQGNIQLIGIKKEDMVQCFNEFARMDFDIGSSGATIRTMSCCIGPARCNLACIDTLGIYQELMREYIGETHRPRFPYKFKIKISGCPNDATGAVARSDLAIIGTWKGPMRIKQGEVKRYADDGLDISRICSKCPTGAIRWDGTELELKEGDCVRCMHCLNKMPRALKPGEEKGATILIGGRARGRYGAFLGWTLIPFIKLKPPYQNLKTLIDNITDWWDENGRTKERIGETIYRLGMARFLRAVELPAVPQQVAAPRANPFWFYWPEEIE